MENDMVEKRNSLMNLLENMMYSLDDDLKDAEYYCKTAKKLHHLQQNEIAQTFVEKAKYRAEQSFQNSKKALDLLIYKLKDMGADDSPSCIQAQLWKSALENYDKWAERIKMSLKDMI